MPEKKETPKPLGQALKEAGKKALGGGIAGALAMVIQVVALMWSARAHGSNIGPAL